MNSKPEYFSTADLNCAAYVMACGHGLVRMERLPDGNRRLFFFPPEARETSRLYYRNTPVPAQTFAHALRDLKGLIHQQA